MRIAASLVALLLSACPAVAAEPTTRPSTGPSTGPALTDNVLDAKGLDYAIEKLNAPMRETDPLPPLEALKKFKPADGLAVDLIAAEPDIRQPLCINFDERGRMWVVQYIQYPFPAGLKVVEYDRYIRAKFDKVPAAPPNHFAGKDVITILEDVDGDGSFRQHKTFVSGLSIATSALPGRGGRPVKAGESDYGVWVINAPYLLFYPDTNRDDVPDSDPIVHLSGFGLEDTHAVASNLTWGPDGWLYGTQGSTCTAKVKTHLGDTSKTTDFLGQAVWRYHPERHVFELFAEGGGNTFGLEFDDAGRCYSGTNYGNLRGMHYVQGGYGVKSWGKHGPLTNPHAYGFFEHMPHTGYGNRLTHTFVVYGGTLMPQYRGKIIAPNSLTSRIQLTRLEPWGSTYKTVEEPHLMTSDDGWFRPVDLKVGPDGAIYIADFYEKRISHVDPRDTWERGSGRIWRIRPADWKPKTQKLDLWTEPAEKLVERLKSDNRWERWTARRVLAERGVSVTGLPTLASASESEALLARELLWARVAASSGGDALLSDAMLNGDAVVRAWAARLAADVAGSKIGSASYDRILDLSNNETDAQVRSQLAASARRMPHEQAIPIIAAMLKRDKDADDPHIPLMLWWAVEAQVPSQSPEWLQFLFSLQQTRIGREFIAPRLARRLMAQPTEENLLNVLTLLGTAGPLEQLQKIADGIKEALAGRPVPPMKPQIREAFAEIPDLALMLRFGNPSAVDRALKSIASEKAVSSWRVELIDAIVQTDADAVPTLMEVARQTTRRDVQVAAVTALTRYNSPEVASELIALYSKFSKVGELGPAIIGALIAKPSSATRLLEAVSSGAIPREAIGVADITRLRQFEDPAVAALVEKVFGKAVRATDAEKAAEVERITRLATTGVGDAERGKVIYTARCGACHALNGEGGQIGPDLTTYDRRNATDMAINIVDPSAYIREEFASFRVKTKAGEAYVGLITERAGDRLTIVDAARQKTVIAKPDIADERAMTVSLMPEGLLAGLSDQEIRDLFKYLATQKP